MNIEKSFQALRLKLHSLSQVGFLRSVSVLVGGTALAQVITVLALPIITRLYTPADFSVLAVYTSILAMVSVVACLQLEIAIPMPEHDNDAANLLVLALFSCTFFAVLAALAVWWFPSQIVNLLNLPALEPFLWLIPPGIWLGSAYAAMQYWTVRKKRFVIVAKTRITQSVGGAGTQLVIGWFTKLGPFGLLLGQAITSGAGLFNLARVALKEDHVALRSVTRTSMRRLFKEYDRFPKFSTFEAFSNSAAIQLPVIIIAAMAIGPDAGYLLLATRAMAIPMGLIGGAVSQVYLSHAPEELRTGRLPTFTAKIIGGLAKSGVGLLIFIGIISPSLFKLVFGDQWQRAGELVAWMTPWFVAQFLVSPVSMALHVTGNLRTALNIQVLGFVFRVGSVIAAGWLAHSYIVEVYAVTGFLFYMLYFILVIKLSQVKIKNLLSDFKTAFKIILMWTCLGIMSAFFLENFYR